MAIEKERKFLLKGLPPKTEDGINIKQGYLIVKGTKQFRVRIIDDKYAKIAYKSKIDSVSKLEFEFDIPLEEAQEMYKSCEHTLEKRRYKTTFDGNIVDIDIYENGSIPPIVEIEFTGELKRLPDYCGEEVTGKREFSNIAIAMKKTIKKKKVKKPKVKK